MSLTRHFARHWSLDPNVIFLNHGSFGACPIEVLNTQAELRARLERQPVQFFVRDFEPMLDASRASLADFIGAETEDVVFVPNATTGVNAVLRSRDFAPGDDLLVTNHEYNACRNALDFVAKRFGARVVVAEIPFPIRSADEAVDAILGAVTPNTRLALLDHITSQSALVLPLERIVPSLRERGIDVLVDGAHAPGMIDLNVTAVGATYYSGNCHKWVCAPKGAGFLWVERSRQPEVRPLTISHGANVARSDRSRYRLEFDWTGTDDPTAALCVGKSIEVMASLVPGGWPEIRRRNHALALTGRDHVCDALGIPAPAPDAMIGSIAAFPIPDGSPEPPSNPLYADPLQESLLADHRVEVPIIPWPAPPKRVLRISAQLYNVEADYEALAGALRTALGTG